MNFHSGAMNFHSGATTTRAQELKQLSHMHTTVPPRQTQTTHVPESLHVTQPSNSALKIKRCLPCRVLKTAWSRSLPLFPTEKQWSPVKHPAQLQSLPSSSR